MVLCVRVRASSPFQKLHVLLVLDEARPHHDCLEALSIDGPQLDVGESCEDKRGQGWSAQNVMTSDSPCTNLWAKHCRYLRVCVRVSVGIHHCPR